MRVSENDKNLVTALRAAKSRSRRILFDAAADRIEELLKENALLRKKIEKEKET